MKIFKKIVLGLVVAGTVNISAYAADYPSKAVKIIVGFTAGSNTDVVARIAAEGLSEKLGVPFIVENKAGANGVLAAQSVAGAKADGYTLLVSNSSMITVNPLIYKDLKYAPLKDFTGITPLVSAPFILAINPDNPRLKNVESLDDLIEKAKAEPDEVTFSSAGVGNLMHLAGEQLAKDTDTQLRHIPYKSGVEAETALYGKEVDFSFVTSAKIPLIKEGKLKALAVTTQEAWHEVPDVPTVADLGYSDFDVSFWVGFLAPSGTPDDIIQLLNETAVEVMNDPKTKEKLKSQGIPDTLSPEDFLEKIKLETKQNEELIKKIDLPKN